MERGLSKKKHLTELIVQETPNSTENKCKHGYRFFKQRNKQDMEKGIKVNRKVFSTVYNYMYVSFHRAVIFQFLSKFLAKSILSKPFFCLFLQNHFCRNVFLLTFIPFSIWCLLKTFIHAFVLSFLQGQFCQKCCSFTLITFPHARFFLCSFDWENLYPCWFIKKVKFFNGSNRPP